MTNTAFIWSFLLAMAFGTQVALAKEGAKCRNATLDCDVLECCAGVSPKTLGVCQPQPQLSQRCNPKIIPGAKRCPCAVGTTCAPSARKRKLPLFKSREVKTYRYKCVPVPTLSPDEQEER